MVKLASQERMMSLTDTIYMGNSLHMLFAQKLSEKLSMFFTSCELSTLHILGYNPPCFYFIACLATGFAITEFTPCMVEATMLDKSVDKSENGLHLSKNSAQLLGASSTAKFRPSVHYRSINQRCAKLSMQLFASKSHMPEKKTSESRVTRDEHVKMRGLSNCSGHSLSVQPHCQCNLIVCTHINTFTQLLFTL